jgi:hypothetical protein
MVTVMAEEIDALEINVVSREDSSIDLDQEANI